MSEPLLPGLGPVRQIGIVVRDIEAAMAHWHRVLGVGPWFYKPRIALTRFSYRGQPSALPELSIAFANSGAMQIELIQQRNAAPSMYLDHLAACGEGVQHLAWWTLDFDALCARLQAQGYQPGHAGQVGERGRFTYLAHPTGQGPVVEVSEQSGGKAEFFRQVAEAAIHWDGHDPVRHVD